MKMKFKDMNTPNKLTTIRMFCVPLVILLFVLYAFKADFFLVDSESSSLTFMQVLIAIFFAFASITDFIDGHMARKQHIVTDYGKLMDPLADKLLVNSTLICLLTFHFFYHDQISAPFSIIASLLAVLTIARDIFVDALRMQALKKGAVVPAMIWGKLKTATLMPGIVILLFGSLSVYVQYVGLALIFCGGLFALISGMMYFRSLSCYFSE